MNSTSLNLDDSMSENSLEAAVEPVVSLEEYLEHDHRGTKLSHVKNMLNDMSRRVGEKIRSETDGNKHRQYVELQNGIEMSKHIAEDVWEKVNS